ncbi:MAG: 1-acyl-sn-glycerol-3-phosphate acyltransferase [Candidatus Hydrogenedentota bacterium]|nr:MAG: 1-acyl-sn-glycerol-3-phosphate acyltransferase [Candidatus Hydrogenedentota bacterium]
MPALVRSLRRQFVRLASRRIESLLDFLEKETYESGILERVKPFKPQEPIDTEAVVDEVMTRLEDELPSNTDWSRVEAEVRDILPTYNPDTHRRFRDMAYFLLDLFFDNSGCTSFFTERPNDIENLNLIPSDTSVSRVIAANHSSNIDDILVGDLADSFGLGLGHFAAGANLMFLPQVEKIMKELNVIKVKRSLGKEEDVKLYKIILERTCGTLTDRGEDFIIFPEANNRQGARSRNGTLRLPERLRVVDGILDSAKDAIVIPIAVSFSRVPEYYKLVHGRGTYHFLRNRRLPLRIRRDYVNGKSALRLFSHSLLMSYRDIYGRACASVGEPFSIKEFLTNHSDPIEPARMVAEESMRRIAKVKKVMPSHIVAEAIEGSDKISIPHLSQQIQVEIDKVIDYHRNTFAADPNFSYEFGMGPRTVMEAGLRELGLMQIISRGRVFFRYRVCVNDRSALAYYGNMSDHRLYSPDYDDKVCVIGAGQWGYTLAHVIGKKFLEDPAYRRHSIVVYDTREEITEALKYKGVHPLFFQGMEPPKIVYPKFSYKDAISNSKVIIIATPSTQFGEVIDSVCKYASRDLDLVIATKGFFHETAELLPVVAREKIEKAKLAHNIYITVVSGANIASEVIRGEICSTQLAGERPERVAELKKLFEGPRLIVHTSTDPIGTSLAGAAKNPYATIYAAAKALGMGENYLGEFMMAATEEILRLGMTLGADPRTFTESHAWWPDLHATSMAGRSSKFGNLLGQKRPPRRTVQAFAERNETVETFDSIVSLFRLGNRQNIRMPIIEFGYQIMHEDAEPTKTRFEQAIIHQPREKS